MVPTYITAGGKKYRVEANWNAIVNFLKSVGRDSFKDFSEIMTLHPSDVAPMMAAAINEGERLDGRDTHVTPEDLGAVCSITELTEFIEIYSAQLNPQDSNSQEESKKD